ncbi:MULTISPECIES: discoidin domain-containing protein [unclassified Lentimonas]|uniref:discoidin domain-containing protein n=1 Tax=unclassified Lentimonas TaxID=2630993 RepID=UPI00138966BE|nr:MULTISPECIES: discoidin domain-containing protein [unclassified Lentimonas]
MKKISHLMLAFTLLGTSSALATDVNLAKGATAIASSHQADYRADNSLDQVVSDDSRWLAAKGDKTPWIEITFPAPVTVEAVDVLSGWKSDTKSVLADFDLSLEIDGVWVTVKAGKIRKNTEVSRRVNLSGRKVAKLRLEVLDGGFGRVREIAVYDSNEAEGAFVEKSQAQKASSDVALDQTIHQIALNQVGYQTAASKRFTAPLSGDGVAFAITAVGRSEVLYEGEIQAHIGDFSDFRPADSDTHYVVTVKGGKLKAHQSDPFLIREAIFEEQYWQSAVDFLIDSRSVVGTSATAYGGCPWRDGVYYDAIIPALALFYSANPELVNAMPHQIDWQAEQARMLAPGFKLDRKEPSDGGALQATKDYYGMEPPLAGASDVAKLIHWGAGYYLNHPVTRDPSRDPLPGQIHPQTVEQVAYVLWAWPLLKNELPQSFYEQCRDFCFANWEGSLEVSEWWDPASYNTVEDVMGPSTRPDRRHPFKGRHAPGHSIVPNLIMHEVAQSEGRADADKYLNAAVKQAEWIIENLDWNDPRTTKGHRMSEHRTIPNLVWLLQKYPKQAPAGLQDKITEWAQIAVSRSDNLWDLRRYDMGAHWTIPSMNDLGNLIASPAIFLSASWVVEDPKLKSRLEQLSTASVDNIFGRNPRIAAAPAHPEKGFPEVERGWPKLFPNNRCARLERCRGTISSLPGSEMYPFNPKGAYRHPEGWVNYGAAWCISLGYLRFDASQTTPELLKK